MERIKKQLKFFLSFKGRLNRKPYFLGQSALFLILIIFMAAITIADKSVEQAESALKTLESAGKSAPDLQTAPDEGAAPAQDISAGSDSKKPEAMAQDLKILFLSLLILAMIFLALAPVTGLIALNVRRLHDLNFSGWWFLPITAVYLFLSWPEMIKDTGDTGAALLHDMLSISSPSAGYFPPALLVFEAALIILFFFIKGSKGENKYGPDPLSSP